MFILYSPCQNQIEIKYIYIYIFLFLDSRLFPHLKYKTFVPRALDPQFRVCIYNSGWTSDCVRNAMIMHSRSESTVTYHSGLLWIQNS